MWLMSVTVACQEVLNCTHVVGVEVAGKYVRSAIVCVWDNTGREHLTGGYWRTGREQGNLTGEERRGGERW